MKTKLGAKAAKPKTKIDFDLEHEIEIFQDHAHALRVLRKAMKEPNLNKRVNEAIEDVMRYLWEPERDNFLDNPKSDHIFLALVRLAWRRGCGLFWNNSVTDSYKKQ